MVGLHVRNVFDAPRNADTNVSVEGKSALEGAEQEYGKEMSDTLLKWRRAAHWSNFVDEMHKLLREDEDARRTHKTVTGDAMAPLRFYLAADSDQAYQGLMETFPGRIVMTKRQCGRERCDFRDCE
jgi:hypothetical protein